MLLRKSYTWMVSGALLAGCGNTVIVDGSGGAGAQGGASASHANASASTTHASTTQGSVSSTQATSTNATTNVVSSVSVSATTTVATTNVASTTIGSVSVVSVSVSQSASTGSGGAPPGWTCPPSFYAHNDGCDCGCGVFDPDCPNPTSTACQFCNDGGSCSIGGGCPGNINPMDNAVCTPVTPEICGNGIDDDFDGRTDCADSDCLGQPGCAPFAWTCDPELYLDVTCDCGCGAIDPACMGSGVAACGNCNDVGSCSIDFCPGFIDPVDNAHCVPAGPEICGNGIDDDHDNLIDCADPDCLGQPGCAPLGWTCPINFYKANDGCDCGCGAFDPDCPDATTASCQFCGDPGTCNTSGACPGNINPVKNGVCN